MTDKHKDVDSYLDSLSAHKRPHSNKLRAMIRKAVPKATESIKYNLPCYEDNGMLCAFAAQKHYFSFYVLNGETVARHKDQLKGLSVGKACIRFKDISELPERLVGKLLREAAAVNKTTFNDHC